MVDNGTVVRGRKREGERQIKTENKDERMCEKVRYRERECEREKNDRV